ncbi:hypothetical protein RUM44_008583 [Polyplax serrata]|uniref:Guanylate cyclase n=1 Tax=Polyplax serrata TaxID=468196 RepID=A0ABR1BD40_POLSC
MWIICLTIASVISYSSSEEYVLGYLTGSQRKPGDLEYSRPGLRISGAISYAVDKINGELSKKGIDRRISFIVAETYGDEEISIDQTARLWRSNVSAYIGPQETCVHEGRMAASFNLPMISYFCTDQETSNKKYFRTFARTRPPDTQISKSLAALLLAYNWRKVIFLYLDSENDMFRKVAVTIIETLKTAKITILQTKSWYFPYQFPYSENPFHRLVEDTHQDARIYVILGSHDEHLGLLKAMEERNLLTGGKYFVVGVELEQYDEKDPGRYMRGLLRDDIDPTVVRAFASYFGIVPTAPVNMHGFSVKVNEYMEKPPFNFSNPLFQLGISKVIPAEAGYLYDAVHLYSKALAVVLDRGEDPLNGTAIIEAIKGTHFQSAMGYMVYIDENGDAEGNYTLLARKPHHAIPESYGLYPVGVFTRQQNTSKLPTLVETSTIHWVAKYPPVAEPICGFRGKKCVTQTSQIMGAIAGTIMLLLIIAGLIFYRNWKYEQELDSLLWKVDYKDILLNEDDMCHTLGNHTKVTRATHPLVRTSQVSLSSNPDADFRYSAIFTTICIYRGRVLALKRVKKKSIDMTRTMKKELKIMRDLRHENLNPFIGACTDAPNICIITEYCSRGSLRDILENEDVKLDNMFVASLVGDIIRGMMYLHDSPVKYHGKLKTSNCLVDSRWVVKLSDFGLREFKKDAEDNEEDANSIPKLEGSLYKSPEILRLENLNGEEGVGTQKGDVYSFSIILHELHSRQGPFGNCGLAHAQILNKVMNYDPLQLPFRPPLEALENSFDFVRECLKECWAEDPDLRPDFKAIRTKLRPMRKGMKPNIFDNMMAMMEKYANNLEALVDDRTDQLMEEKKKTEALLYEMLPRSVAEQLKRGNKVEAENFDSVTIYFSDIVGFTAMSAESTPLQVVDFLNDLYTCFDSTIENYDVYKVETIGDAYMVVSGLPIRNGDQHAGEIATMSLHLLEAVEKFQIKHRPNENVKLRIGIHSGPVCAGVVGLKMPRYCLFGDTVNTASRMESTGNPGRIHCSIETKTLLNKLGGYHLSERGIVSMKGKGNQFTYWLVGENPEDRAKRSEERAARRAMIAGVKNKAKQNQRLNPNIPRSSLKSKHKSDHLTRNSPISRCASLEYPKKLRFARFDNEESSLEVIADNSPKKMCLLEVHSNPEGFRRTSSSCPCIEKCENVNGASETPHMNFPVLANNNNYASSVPTLNDAEYGNGNGGMKKCGSDNLPSITFSTDTDDMNVSVPLLKLVS